ncbi:MAG: serine protease [Longimicrobiales bacterium]|nr:serine protease [Longimicrobiales bacterium]
MRVTRDVRFGAVAGCAAVLVGSVGCVPDREPAAGWVDGAAAVRPAVHSVWATRPALERMAAFTPVGSGFTVAVDSAAALVLTNAHVVADTGGTPHPRLSVLVQADTGAVLYPAEVLALDPGRDLALLGIADTTLTPVGWRADRVAMGEPVATIGYGLPEGGIVDTAGAQVMTRFTVARRFTAGHASSYRTLEPGDPSTNVLEVSLFLFPGVSGGPTFTRDGRVLGVNRGGWELRAETTSYGHVIPVLVVRQFLRASGYEAAVFADSGES